MQKKITLLGTLFLAITMLLLTAASQQQKDKKDNGNAQKNERKAVTNQPDKMKGGGKDNGRNNNGNVKEMNDRRNDRAQNGSMKVNGNDKIKGDRGNIDMDKKGMKDNGRGDKNNGNDAKLKFEQNVLYGYDWNDNDFKDRKKYKNQDKVDVCHKVKRNGEPGVAIRVSENALKAHMNHGDVVGDCAAVANPDFSDNFLRNRRDYYNNLQNTQEEIYYSRSVLDYALLRLANSRSQLQQMQSNNMPAADIQRKQLAVTALEQNTTLLQTLVGVAVEVVANKLL